MTEVEALGISRRLDRDFVRHGQDSLLDMCASLGRTGLPIAVGIIVDGVIVRGAMTAPRTFAFAADEALLRAINAFGSKWDAEMRGTVEGVFSKIVEEHDEREKAARKVADRYLAARDSDDKPLNIDDIELDDVKDVFRALAEPSVIQLAEAKLFATTGQWIEIGTMRVEVHHIAAWWPLDEESGAQVNYVGSQNAAPES